MNDKVMDGGWNNIEGKNRWPHLDYSKMDTLSLLMHIYYKLTVITCGVAAAYYIVYYYVSIGLVI